MKTAAKKTITRSSDNCDLMSLLLCRDGLLHRYCEVLRLFIADWNNQATCLHHRFASEKGARR